MEDLIREEHNKTIGALILEKSVLEKKIIELEAKLELMKELFDEYCR